jgi:hypothetical protein
MTKQAIIKRYENESGNAVLNNDEIVDHMGKYVGHFTIAMAKNYHEIVIDLGDRL